MINGCLYRHSLWKRTFQCGHLKKQTVFFFKQHFNEQSINKSIASKKYRDCSLSGSVPGQLSSGFSKTQPFMAVGRPRQGLQETLFIEARCGLSPLLDGEAVCVLRRISCGGCALVARSPWCTRVFPAAPTISCFFSLSPPFFPSYSFTPAMDSIFVVPPKCLCCSPNPCVGVGEGVLWSNWIWMRSWE